MLRLILLLVARAGLTQGYTDFKSTCTLPASSVNFVTSADVRGTLDILWSSLFTIFACTWTIQYLNVPEQREDRDPGWLGNIKWAMKNTWTSTKWMLATILAPELLLGKAAAELDWAKNDLKELEELAAEDQVPWTLTHSLFANMGGFVIKINKESGAAIQDPAEIRLQNGQGNDDVMVQQDGNEHARIAGNIAIVEEAPRRLKDDATHDGISLELQQHVNQPTQIIGNESHVESTSQKLNHAAVASNRPSGSQATNPSMGEIPTYHNPLHLIASEILELRKAALLPKLPSISIEAIKDKNKSDALVRVIAIIQISWAVLQIIVRAARHLAISQLEIAVIAFALCAIAIYVLNWAKPQGIQVPYTLLQYEGDIPSPIIELLKQRNKDASMVSNIINLPNLFIGQPPETLGAPISNSYNDEGKKDSFVGLWFGIVAFSGLHLAAWNFTFPTRPEQIAWWASSIFCSVIYFLFILPVPIVFMLGERPIGMLLWNNYCILLTAFYILARLYLLVEIFRTLCYLPPDAYIATWASNIPHVA